ncbi:hypothetical protein BD324DRAFT_615943 [Kockovaella imperatae]|uniref:FAD/NAD(P)-binding domain-containing protein n=1 Tax=Kockovaella imperatae TaxID=4999 RepID=A0A1Y1US58_9TREE|nr:hypothetical protein BD324DRAFT_615943 [Kockovaella imperatae]ORX40015.1 hypothetical protein BD324DRAFT_615943 [Kockovaella imperatae]
MITPAAPTFGATASSSPSSSTRTVVVLGASYGGARAARVLAQNLPEGWRLVVIDRNSHFNHVYVFPRYTILAKHAAKGFIPYTNLLDVPPATPTSAKAKDICGSPSRPLTPPMSPQSALASLSSTAIPSSASSSSSSSDSEGYGHSFIQGSITSLTTRSVSFVRPNASTRRGSSESIASIRSNLTYGCFDGPEETIHFDYCIYALGSGMPDPVNVWSEYPVAPRHIQEHPPSHGLGTKKGGIAWMQRQAEELKSANTVLIVGGGALGIQYATDLKDLYPHKNVTLLHSRTRLMPIYPVEMHIAIVERLATLGVNVVLGERVMTAPDHAEHYDGKVKHLLTDKGRQFDADLVLFCTGQKPHSQILAALSPSSISPTTGRIRVTPHLQVSPRPTRPVTSRANTLDRLSNITLRPVPPPSPPSSSGSARPSGEFADVFEEEELGHIFAIGDCAETSAIQAGHTAYWMGEVAARNILRLIRRDEGGEEEELEVYKPGVPAIKVTLGLHHSVTSNHEGVSTSDKGAEDLQARLIWPSVGAGDLDDHA